MTMCKVTGFVEAASVQRKTMGTRSMNYLVLASHLWRPAAVSAVIGERVGSTHLASLFIFESNFTPMWARDTKGDHCTFDLEQEVELQKYLGTIQAADFRLVRAGEEFGSRGEWIDHPFIADHRVVHLQREFSAGISQPSEVSPHHSPNPPAANPFETPSVLTAPWAWKDVRSEDGNRRIALLLQTTAPSVPLNDPVVFALREDWLGKLSPERVAALEMVRRSPEMLGLLDELADYAESATLENDELPDCLVQAKLLVKHVRSLVPAARG